MAVINNRVTKVNSYVTNQPVVDFDPVKFDHLVENKGVRVKVYKTTLCPNVKKIDTGEHEIQCQLCFGTNFIDRSPVDTWSLIGNQTLHRDFQKEGVWDDQQVQASFLRGVELQYFAKVELIDFTTTYYELIQRQEGQLDRLKYPAYEVQLLIDQNGVEYDPTRDLQITENGDIKWLHTDSRPAIGTIYTVYYTYPITFRAINALHVNRFTQRSQGLDYREPIQLNEQWILKRDYLLTRLDLDGNPLKPNKVFVETTPEDD